MGRLWLAFGCGRGGEMNDTAPPEGVEARAHVRSSARDLDIF